MSHFALVNDQNIVENVVVVPDEEQHRANEYLPVGATVGGRWIQTCYHTRNGVHELGGTPLRKNYAGIGYSYDPVLDEFNPPTEETNDQEPV